jgi:hypothetical protein
MKPSRQGTLDFSAFGDSPRLRRKDSLLSEKDSIGWDNQIAITKNVHYNFNS